VKAGLYLAAGALCLIAAWQPAHATLAKASSCMPYIGESLSFSVNWEFINAGSSTMNVMAAGQGYRIKTFARTNRFLDIFKKVRDYITAEGLCVNGKMQSTVFDANLHERTYVAKKQARFLWKENKVLFTQNKNTEIFDVDAGHLSIIDAFFAVRKLNLKAGESVSIPIFDSRKRYDVEVNVSAETKMLKAPWGETVECLIIEPRLKTAGIFASKGKMKIWMTNDALHLPLKVVAKIKIGHIIINLSDYKAQQAIIR